MKVNIGIPEIEATIPHRRPFLLLDAIHEITDDSIVGIKNVSYNENFFQGHFPGEPIMPGVLQIEALAQLAAFKVIKQKREDEGNNSTPSVYFLSIKEAKFRKKVVPGDTLRLEVHATRSKGSRLAFSGKSFVGNDVACEAQMLAMLR